MELDSVVLSRMLTTLTLAFHIIFATIGVGVPVMISIAEWLCYGYMYRIAALVAVAELYENCRPSHQLAFIYGNIRILF
jgi:hypothetical protein